MYFIIATENQPCQKMESNFTIIISGSCLFLLGLVCVLDQIFDVIGNMALAQCDTLLCYSRSVWSKSDIEDANAYHKQTITLLHVKGSDWESLCHFFDLPGSRFSGISTPDFVCGWFRICVFLL